MKSGGELVAKITDINRQQGSTMLKPKRVASGSKSYLMWSGGCELSLAKLLDSLRFALHVDQKPYCLQI